MLSEDAGETWSTLFQAAHAVPAAAITQDGVLFFGNPEEGLFRFALTEVGDTRPAQVSMTPTRGLAASGGRLYSIGDELSDGYSVAVSADDGATFTPFFALCKNHIAAACNAETSVGTVCTFGIETEPWQPLGAACTPKSPAANPSEPPQATGGASAGSSGGSSGVNAQPTPSATGQPRGKAQDSAVDPEEGSDNGSCSVGRRPGSGLTRLFTMVATGMIVSLRKRARYERDR